MIVLGLVLLLFSAMTYLYATAMLPKNRLVLDEVKNDHPKIAVLVPARDESRVIADLLSSLERQSVEIGSRNIYVIVESELDPTVEICKKYNVRVVVRKDLSKQRKGYALDEAVQMILSEGKHYDLYFVFDTDNVMKNDYVEKMLETYRQGYKMATGYRNAKNGNANIIAAASSLTFSMINVIGNRRRNKYNANVVFSGTGCYVVGELVEEWQGWPFHTLTEDYEMSLYATLHDVSTFYNEEAVFYDEQPTKYRQTVDQRMRWIKGYFSSRREFLPAMRKKEHVAANRGSIIRERIGVTPLILVILGTISLVLGVLWRLIMMRRGGLVLWLLGLVVLAIYFILMCVTIVILCREKLDLSRAMKLKVILFNPLYLLTYIPCAAKAILKKDVAWKKIEHGEKSGS